MTAPVTVNSPPTTTDALSALRLKTGSIPLFSTVTLQVAVAVPTAAVMSAEPSPVACTKPFDTVATAALLVDHVTASETALPSSSVTVAVRVTFS